MSPTEWAGRHSHTVTQGCYGRVLHRDTVVVNESLYSRPTDDKCPNLGCVIGPQDREVALALAEEVVALLASAQESDPTNPQVTGGRWQVLPTGLGG